jgi:hypothetical protein
MAKKNPKTTTNASLSLSRDSKPQMQPGVATVEFVVQKSYMATFRANLLQCFSHSETRENVDAEMAKLERETMISLLYRPGAQRIWQTIALAMSGSYAPRAEENLEAIRPIIDRLKIDALKAVRKRAEAVLKTATLAIAEIDRDIVVLEATALTEEAYAESRMLKPEQDTQE